MTVKLALRLNLYRAAELRVPVETLRRAESLGYHSVWTAEAYGSDALSPLAYLAAFVSSWFLRHDVRRLLRP